MAVTVKFLSGLKEIGGTFVEIETESAKCMFDFGYAKGGSLDRAIPLREEYAASDLALTGILPRTDGIYDERNAAILNVLPYGSSSMGKECFILISHLHIDHMGGLGCLHPDVPVYMTEDSFKLYERLAANDDVQGKAHENCIGVKPGMPFLIGDIEVTPVETDHDIKGACGYIIKSQGKTICYTGDFRFHGFHSEVTRSFFDRAKEESIDLLIMESTMVSFDDVDLLALEGPNEETRTEENLLSDLAERANSSDGLLLADFYPRNVERVHRLIDLMKQNGRRLVLDDMTYDYVHTFYPDDDFYVYGETIRNRNRKIEGTIVTRDEILKEPGRYMLQLEHLTLYETASFRNAGATFLHFDGPPLGDYDPAYGKMLELLDSYGIPFERLGVSGHAEPYYLRYVVDEVAPKIFVPLHSFRPEQVQSTKAGRRILPEEGECITL